MFKFCSWNVCLFTWTAGFVWYHNWITVTRAGKSDLYTNYIWLLSWNEQFHVKVFNLSAPNNTKNQFRSYVFGTKLYSSKTKTAVKCNCQLLCDHDMQNLYDIVKISGNDMLYVISDHICRSRVKFTAIVSKGLEYMKYLDRIFVGMLKPNIVTCTAAVHIHVTMPIHM